MPKEIDDRRLEVFRDPEIADRASGILELVEAMRHHVQVLYGASAAADVVTTIGLDVMNSVLIATTDPERYGLVCKDIDKTLYKIVVAQEKDRDSKEKE
jgi:hypothetical protein